MSVVSLQIRKQFPCRTQVPLYMYRQTSGGAASNRHAIPSPPPLPQRSRPYTDGRMEKGREFHCLHIPLQCSCLATNWETGLRVAESLFLRKSFIFLSRERTRIQPPPREREENGFTVLLFLSVEVKIYSYCLLLLSNDKLWKKLTI